MDDFVDEENVKNVENNVENFCSKVPQICLLEVQSSTESDKTVLSTTTVFEQQLRALNSDCSLPSSPGLICMTPGKLGRTIMMSQKFESVLRHVMEILLSGVKGDWLIDYLIYNLLSIATVITGIWALAFYSMIWGPTPPHPHGLFVQWTYMESIWTVQLPSALSPPLRLPPYTPVPAELFQMKKMKIGLFA